MKRSIVWGMLGLISCIVVSVQAQEGPVQVLPPEVRPPGFLVVTPLPPATVKDAPSAPVAPLYINASKIGSYGAPTDATLKAPACISDGISLVQSSNATTMRICVQETPEQISKQLWYPVDTPQDEGGD